MTLNEGRGISSRRSTSNAGRVASVCWTIFEVSPSHKPHPPESKMSTEILNLDLGPPAFARKPLASGLRARFSRTAFARALNMTGAIPYFFLPQTYGLST